MKKNIFFICLLSFSFAHADKPNVTACATCHGAQGEGNTATGIPRLAKLPAAYILEQLNDYASEVRSNSVMTPLAKVLLTEEKSALADYYADLEFSKNQKVKASKSSLISQGEHLASVGNQKMQLQACANCHGPGGTGQYTFIPMLAGQPSNYILAQLQAWKTGSRKNSQNQMLPVVQRLDDKSMQALSAYFSQVKVK